MPAHNLTIDTKVVCLLLLKREREALSTIEDRSINQQYQLTRVNEAIAELTTPRCPQCEGRGFNHDDRWNEHECEACIGTGNEHSQLETRCLKCDEFEYPLEPLHHFHVGQIYSTACPRCQGAMLVHDTFVPEIDR